MMGRAGRPQFDDHGVALILVQDVKKHFYKKFLYEPFPVEARYPKLKKYSSAVIFAIFSYLKQLVLIVADFTLILYVLMKRNPSS